MTSALATCSRCAGSGASPNRSSLLVAGHVASRPGQVPQFTARLWVPAGTLRCMESESAVTVRDLLAAGGTPDGAVAQLGVLWGKSAERGGGQPSLLVTHLLDTAAVAEVMWDEYLAPVTRAWLDALTAGDGRRFFAWVCGIHDVGKASPAFQCKSESLAAGVKAAGLEWTFADTSYRDWGHWLAGGVILQARLKAEGWSDPAREWLPTMLTGHHGKVPQTPPRGLVRASADAHGRSEEGWEDVQIAVVDVVGRALGYTPLPPEPVRFPNKAEQLHLLGLVIMADWIASNSDVLPGVWDVREVSLPAARVRARNAWAALELRGGWRALLEPAGDVVQQRFGFASRPLQSLVVEVARTAPRPLLLIVEAPMGEGKTEAALAAAEVLAARFGADGIFVGMPTQATSDPMYHRVRRWADSVQPGLPVALLHGRSRFNPEWKAALAAAEGRARARGHRDGYDQFEMADPYGETPVGGDPAAPATGVVPAPAHWFLGHGRPLLTPLVVGTIDQVLMAGARVRRVMLRFAGLAGKVVVLDEVHAADVYMSGFLQEALWWLGQAQTPVIMLSATLAPAQRHALTRAYLAGASGLAPDHLEVDTGASGTGYPMVAAAWADDDGPHVEFRSAEGRCGGARLVRVTHLPEDPGAPDTAVVDLLQRTLGDGGCALVIRNTVDRAQHTYSALRGAFGDDVVLLHARLTAADRAERTQRALTELGPPPAKRPPRRIVVATQLAEQSFDIDADIVITDLAPVDLLLQRAGRLHRHQRPPRPAQVCQPVLVVTGFTLDPAGLPEFEGGARAIYTSHLLLRAAELVLEATRGTGWQIPQDVPGLVARAYDNELPGPAEWSVIAGDALREWKDREGTRAEKAKIHTLTRNGHYEAETIEGLHVGATQVTSVDPEPESVVVRDGERSVEVVLVRQDDRGYSTWTGQPLGPNGDASRDFVDDVAAGLIRLPARKPITDAALKLGPLPGWVKHPWLGWARALVLDEDGSTILGGHALRYDDELGLVMTRQR